MDAKVTKKSGINKKYDARIWAMYQMRVSCCFYIIFYFESLWRWFRVALTLVSSHSEVIYEVFRRHFAPVNWRRNSRKVTHLRVESDFGTTLKCRTLLVVQHKNLLNYTLYTLNTRNMFIIRRLSQGIVVDNYTLNVPYYTLGDLK